MARILRNDTVVVISGKDKGKDGKVLRVDNKNNKVLVEGVNMMFKHMRKSQKHPQGARVQLEMPMHISNVMLKDPKTGKRTRVHYKLGEGDGVRARLRKQRVAKSGEVLEKNTD